MSLNEFDYISSSQLDLPSTMVKELGKLNSRDKSAYRDVIEEYGINDQDIRGYVEPRLQEFAPSTWLRDQEPDDEVSELAYSFIKRFFKKKHRAQDGRNNLLILANTGMGKTLFLVALKLQKIAGLWPPDVVCELLRLGPGSFSRIEQIENPENTILLLDGFDNDFGDDGINIYDRIKELFIVTKRFYRVIITCRQSFFPIDDVIKHDEDRVTSRLKAYGFTCSLKYLSTFDDEQIFEYLEKRALKYKWMFSQRKKHMEKDQIKKVLDTLPLLRYYPILLNNIESLVDYKPKENSSSKSQQIYHVFRYLASKWIARYIEETGTKNASEFVLQSFCELATYCYSNNIDEFSAKEFRSYVDGDMSGVDVIERCMFRKTTSGNYRFRHAIILEFFTAQKLVVDRFFTPSIPIKINDQIFEFMLGRIADGDDSEYIIQSWKYINLANVRVPKFDLENLDLSDADLRNADLRNAKFLKSKLQNADISNANLVGTSFFGANLVNTNLSNSDLTKANLFMAALQEANLEDANLERANLQAANLLKANLKRANFKYSNLQEANLEDADITGANFEKARGYSRKLKPS